jgi:excisionase family DNA binding protein
MEAIFNKRSDDWMHQATLSVDETASVLGISRNSVYAAIRAGDVPSIRVGRRFLVPTALLAELLGLSSKRSPVPSDSSAEPGASQRVDESLPL